MTPKPLIVMAAVAGLVLAGGVAYASIPDAGGVIHGCYQKTNGQLRVIDTGSCGPSETPLPWNQTGPTGAKGATGPTGPTGPEGLGATSGTTTVPNDGSDHTLVTLDNGIALQGVCGPGTRSVQIGMMDASGGSHLKLWGTFTTDFVLTPTSGDDLSFAGPPYPGASEVDLSVVARNKAVGPFAHIDLQGSSGPSCNFSWMAIPSSG